MIRPLKTPAFALLFFACLLDNCPAEGVTLRWQLQSGQKFTAIFEQQTTLKTTVNKQPVEMKIDMTMALAWEVGETAADSLPVRQKLTQIRLKMESPEVGVIEYDSASPEPPAPAARSIAQALAPLVGVEFTLNFTARGEITEVRLSPEAEAALSAPQSARMKELFSPEKMREMLRQTLLVLPAEAVEKGDQWTTKTAVKTAVGGMQQTMQATYQGEDEAGLNVIELASNLQLQRPADEQPLTIKEQSGAGKLWFNNNAGRFQKAELKQQLTTESSYRDTLIQVEANSELKMTLEAN